MTDKPGVFYGWVIVAAGFILLFLEWGFQYSYGVFFSELCQDLNWTSTIVSGAYSLFMFWHCITYLLAGRLNDEYGPRLTLAISVIIMSSGYALMSIVNSPWQLYIVYGIVIGTGGGFGFVPVTSTVARWFTAKRGLALGIVVAGVGMGTLALAPFAQFLISRFEWRTSYLIIAGILLVIGLPVSRLMKLEPAERGLLSDGTKEMVKETKRSGGSATTMDFTLGQAIKTKAFWLLVLMGILLSFTVQMVMVHLKTYATDVGITPMIAATILGFVGGFSVLGRVVVGSASDRIGRRGSFFIAAILLAVMMLWLTVARQPWQFYLFSVVFGFGYGSWIPLFPAVIADWFGMKHHGAIFGTVAIAPGVGGAIGPLLAGRIFDVTGGYNMAIVIGAGVAFVAAVCSYIVKAPSANAT